MFQTQNLCPRSKNVFDSMAKTLFVSEQQNLYPRHMFPARLNWETFASATMFPSLARPLCPKGWFQFNSRIVRAHFSSIMTLNN